LGTVVQLRVHQPGASSIPTGFATFSYFFFVKLYQSTLFIHETYLFMY